MVLISNTSCCKRFQQVTTCTHTICTQTFLVGHFPWVLFDHSYRNLHLALLFQGIQFIFLDLTIIWPLHCSSHFFPQIPPQKFQHSSATGLPSLVLLKQSFLIAFKQSFLPLNCVVLSSQCLNFAAWVVTLCLNSSSTIIF